MKKVYRLFLIVTIIVFGIQFQLIAGDIKGKIIDKQTKETLIGVTVQIVGTTIGTVTDLDGNYAILNVQSGNYELEVRYVSYKIIKRELTNFSNKDVLNLDFEMEADLQMLEAVSVVAKKNLENEMTLLKERQTASIAIENIGAKEMSAKGISNAADGVKKITGISLFDEGRLIVRGLGDRYSSTTLNGLPIASPNPDNKLIPLDLFPSSVIKNITVKKVYDVGIFADYSGANIDISTRENIGEDFLRVSISSGGRFNSLFKEFYQSDKQSGLWNSNNLSSEIINMTSSQFSNYVKSNNVFGTDFSIEKSNALPDFGINVGFGKDFKIGHNNLGILTSLSIDNSSRMMENVYTATLTAQGAKLNEFTSNSYSSELNITGLVSVGYYFRKSDRINYTLFYARNAIDNYKLRDGYDSEKVHLIGSNSVLHIYRLLNNQLNGKHNLGRKFDLFWNVSYGITGSYEPDRRQVMYRVENDIIKLFKLNQQETMRYFGELTEDELVGDIRSNFNFGENNLLKIGTIFKTKNREYHSNRFYYNINNINPYITSIEDIFDPNSYLNQENISNGIISILKDAQPKSSYYAGNDIFAAFTDVDFYPTPSLLINVGVRLEQANKWVRYWTDASLEKLSQLNTTDFFPALNLKYQFNKTNDLKFSASKTVTRPEFVEMAPFLYKESFGSDEIRGNEDLKNGYNYNLDLRYERYSDKINGDLLSLAGYIKYLDKPIERIQESSGGSSVHSFRNADNGFAAGLELEIRKQITENFKLGLNASYIFTNVVLPEDGGVYTDTRRALQGASPYLVNADVTYAVKVIKEQQLKFSLLYNLQGPRIHTVGIYGVGNVIQKELHMLNFITHYDFTEKLGMSFKLTDLLNTTIRYTQEVKTTGEVIEVGRYLQGIGMNISLSYKF